MDQKNTALHSCLQELDLEEELEEAVFRSEVTEVVTQEELQADGTLMEDVLDFLAVMELKMVPGANPVDKTQVTLMTMEIVEMITAEMMTVETIQM